MMQVTHSYFTSFRIRFYRQIIVLLLFLSCNQVYGQNQSPQHKLDSLIAVNERYKAQDTTRLKNMINVMRQYMRTKNFEKGEALGEEVVLLAHQWKMGKWAGSAYYRLGAAYHVTNFFKSEAYYKKSVAEYLAVNDQSNAAGAYLNMGALYMGLPDYAKALEMNQRAIGIFEKDGNDASLGSCYANIAEIYIELKQYANSLKYLNLALRIFGPDDATRGTAVVYENMGGVYMDASQEQLKLMNTRPDQRYGIALNYLNKALKIATFIEDHDMVGSIQADLGKLYEQSGQKELALKAYQNSLEINKEADDNRSTALSNQALGVFLLHNSDYDGAIKYLKQAYALAENFNLNRIERDLAQSLSEVYEKKGDFNTALNYYKRHVVLKDQIFGEEKEKEITRQQMQLDFGVKEREYVLKQKITDVELQKQLLLARQQQQRLMLNKQQLAISDQEKSLQRLKFLSTQREMQNEKKLQESNFQRSKLLTRYQASQRDKMISRQDQQIKFDSKVKLFLIIAISLALFATGLIYFNQRKTNRLNRIINSQKAELEQLGKVKDRIFSVVSHDMRTPVNSLISFIQLLEAGEIEQAKLKRYAASLKNNLSYTSSMMENLLNWAASQMQGFNPYLEVLSVHEVAVEVINSLKGTAENKKIEIRNEIPEHIAAIADLNMISLVLRNLISNSIKFTPEGGHITLFAGLTEGRVRLTVCDNGRGMTEAQIQHFNKSGYQGAGVSTPGTNKEKGTGLGLLLCRTFIALMNGSIQINPQPSSGTEFIILMPNS